MQKFNKWWLMLLSLPLGGILATTVWALDTRYITEEALDKYTEIILEPRYITIGELKEFVEEQKRAELEQRVDELRLKKSLNMASEYEKALLEQLERKL
jgi:hypothetical protein